jgi:hypothetical protein
MFKCKELKKDVFEKWEYDRSRPPGGFIFYRKKNKSSKCEKETG